MSEIQVAFVGKVVFENPTLRPLLADHLNANQGEIFPYAFMSELAKCISEGGVDSESTKSMLALMESSFDTQNDDDVSNLIAVGFVESLVALLPETSSIWKIVPPNIKEFARAWGNQEWR
ncbi:hypothetical protein SAMN04488117_11869 [Celeribacter baekdonensis]|uniref:DUF7674 domain-containing protein n=1 Tax=Celeribacter baekdonensis TaxID=875171 RepID=A0A1G7TUG1_9RHOB|nr:hypothetical protein [Celeribacter baekdonensis]SDG38654.1 hypothetical protein SAMN04488117_11869 [Celeribacter baekdonensis]